MITPVTRNSFIRLVSRVNKLQRQGSYWFDASLQIMST